MTNETNTQVRGMCTRNSRVGCFIYFFRVRGPTPRPFINIKDYISFGYSIEFRVYYIRPLLELGKSLQEHNRRRQRQPKVNQSSENENTSSFSRKESRCIQHFIEWPPPGDPRTTCPFFRKMYVLPLGTTWITIIMAFWLPPSMVTREPP